MSERSRASRLSCACASLRRATRAVTQLYDDELRKLGLKSTQLTVLQMLGSQGSTTQARLAELLALDSTTMSRNVKVLEGNGWIESSEGTDRRERHLRLSDTGRDLVKKAEKPWARAQEKLKAALGSADWETLLHVTDAVTRATRPK